MTPDMTGNSAGTPVPADNEPLDGFAPARYCWLLPIFGMGASMVINLIDRSLGIAGFFIFALAIVVGLVLSIVCLFKGRGHRRTLVHGIVGLAVNLAFVALVVLMFFAIARVRQAARAAEARRQEALRVTEARSQPRPSAPLSKPPEITSEQEVEDFHDLVFWIQEHKQLPDGTQSLRASGVHQGQAVGVEFVLGASWKSGSLGKDLPLVVYQGSVACRATGPESDAFCRVLDGLYGTKAGPPGMTKEVAFTALTLGGDPRNLAKGPVKIKLFRDSGKEEDYAEAYFNIEMSARKCAFCEKDAEYRPALIRAFAGSAGQK